MQKVKVPYNPALDDGGGAPGAEPQRSLPGEIGDAMYTDSFETDCDFVHDLLSWQPPELYMPSGNPVTAPLDTQPPENLIDLYHYLRSHSSSLTQPNLPGRIHSSNDNFHSQSTGIAIHSNSYHPVSPEFSIDHAPGVGSNRDAVRPPFPFTCYDRDHRPISPSQEELFDDNWLLESAQFDLPPAQNNVSNPQVRNTPDLASSQGLWGHTSPLQPTSGPFVTTSSLNAPMPTRMNNKGNDTWFVSHPTLPQGIDMGFTVSPELQVHYASPPRLPPPSTEEPSFNSYPLYSPQTYPPAFPHQESFKDRAPRDVFDPVGVGTACQRAHLYGHPEQTLSPISEITIPPLVSLHHGPRMWMPYQQTNLVSPGLPIAVNYHEGSPPQSLSSSSEVFGYTGQAGGKVSSDGPLSSSATTMIRAGARTPATEPSDTPDYGGLNPFLSQHNSLGHVRKRSRQCRPRVLKPDDCPPTLRPYYNTDIPIPRHECDNMYKKYGDKEHCIKCGYDVTPPRRSGLKYEHVSSHINNRPYHCLHCNRGFFRKSNHSKTHHPPLWRTTPPSSR